MKVRSHLLLAIFIAICATDCAHRPSRKVELPPAPPGLTSVAVSPKRLVKAIPQAPVPVPPGFRIQSFWVSNGVASMQWNSTNMVTVQGMQSLSINSAVGSWHDITTSGTGSVQFATGNDRFFRLREGRPTIYPSFINENVAARPDGLHGVIMCELWGRAKLYTWRTGNDLATIDLPWNNLGWNLDWTVQFLGESDFLVAGIVNFGEPVSLFRFDARGNQLQAPILMGDGCNRFPKSCRLRDGSVVVVSYCHIDNTGSQIFNIAHIFTNGMVWQHRYDLPPAYASIAAQRWTIAQGFDNRIYCFFARDSTGRLGKVVFTPLVPELRLDEYNPDFLAAQLVNGLPRDGLASPNGEMPFPYAAPDLTNNRIVIGYNNWPNFWECWDSNHELYAHQALTGIPAVGWHLVAQTSGYAERASECAVFPRGDGIFFAAFNCFDPTRCTHVGSRIYRVDSAGTVPVFDFDAQLWASNADGWIVWKGYDEQAHFDYLP